MKGALPAGDYHLSIRGFQPSLDGVLQIDLLYRPQGGSDQILASQKVADAMTNVDGGFPGDLNVVLSAPAVTPRCGDQLVLRIHLLQGKYPYSDFNPTLTTP